MKIKTTFDQWLILKTVVEEGGFAQAAESLHRSQSTISYALSQLQSQLGVKILEIKGRKAVLTSVGKILYHRGCILLENAAKIEKIAANTKQDWPAEITIVVDDPFPRSVLSEALKKFSLIAQTRVQLHEVSLSGALDALEHNNSDIVIAFKVPTGYAEFAQVEIIQVAVAHPNHPLHHYAFQLTSEDLKGHLQLVIKDSGKKNTHNMGWLEASHRWSISSSQLSLKLITEEIGFAWLPFDYVKTQNSLKPLPLNEMQTRRFFLNALFGKKEPPNKAALFFAACLKDVLYDYHNKLEQELADYLENQKEK